MVHGKSMIAADALGELCNIRRPIGGKPIILSLYREALRLIHLLDCGNGVLEDQ